MRKMASRRTSTAIRNGKPIRRESSPRDAKRVRSDARVERLVSIQAADNADISEWLISASRKNPTLKSARNLGGLSLTLIQSKVLTHALMRKYSDYGKLVGMTGHYQRELSDRFSNFATQQRWGSGMVTLENRLIFLGPKTGAQLGAVCFGVTDREVLEQHAQAIDYLVYEEGLDIPPGKGFTPHITIDSARHKDMQILSLPQIPKRITLDAPGLSTFVGTERRY